MATGILMFLLGIFVMILFYFSRRLSGRVHVAAITVQRPFDEVWNQLADINNYTKLFPKWITKLENGPDNWYTVSPGYSGRNFRIRIEPDKLNKRIDFYIALPGEDGPETPLLRLTEYKPEKTVIAYISQKWKGTGRMQWLLHTFRIDSDFRRLKKILEA